MTRATLLLAAAVVLASAPIDSFAQQRHGIHRHHYYPHFHSRWPGPYRPWHQYRWGYWPAPVFTYPYPIHEPGPVYVEPAPPPYYGERPLPYRERSYAEAQPSKPAPKAPAAQPMPERYTLSATELFEFDKAELRLPQPKLDEIAAALKANPEVNIVTITGYTDRLGSEEYNLELSMRRAAAVKSYLVGKGVDRERLKAVGKGEANPVAHCDDTLKRAELIKCLEPNRRVEVERITVERRAP